MLIPFATRPAQPMYWRFTPGGGGALLLLARLVQRPDRHPPPPRPAGRLVQPGRRVLPDLAHRRLLVPRRPAQQPLRPVRRPVPGMLGDRPPVPRRQLAGQRGHVLARLQPRLRPGEARPQQAHQDRPLPHRPAGPYPGSSSRPCFICSHKLMISGRLPSFHGNLPRPSRLTRSEPNWRLPY